MQNHPVQSALHLPLQPPCMVGDRQLWSPILLDNKCSIDSQMLHSPRASIAGKSQFPQQQYFCSWGSTRFPLQQWVEHTYIHDTEAYWLTPVMLQVTVTQG